VSVTDCGTCCYIIIQSLWWHSYKCLILHNNCGFSHLFNVNSAAQNDLARPPPEPWQELLTCGDTVQMIKCPSPDIVTYVLLHGVVEFAFFIILMFMVYIHIY